MKTRRATPQDAPAIARIYNQGIEERLATFETQPRSSEEVEAWLGKPYPVVVVEENGQVIAFATASEYRPRACYAGVAEFSVYVARDRRGVGAGRLAVAALIEALEEAGFLKLLSRVFPENVASRRLLKSLGFREVGTYEKHGQLDGVWKNVVIVERLIATNLSSVEPR